MGAVLKLFALLVIIAAVLIVFIHRLKRKRQKPLHRDPILDEGQQQDEVGTAINEEESLIIKSYQHQTRHPLENSFDDDITHQQTYAAAKKDSHNNHNGVITLSVLAKESQAFQGYELLQTLLANGLRYGKMNIFHRHQEANGRGPILFSLASATEPGTFELAKMGSTICRGLALFMRVTGQPDLSQTLELMVETARQLAEDLHGVVVGDDLKPLSTEKIKQWRERIRAYEQGQHTADLFEYEQN